MGHTYNDIRAANFTTALKMHISFEIVHSGTKLGVEF